MWEKKNNKIKTGGFINLGINLGIRREGKLNGLKYGQKNIKFFL